MSVVMRALEYIARFLAFALIRLCGWIPLVFLVVYLILGRIYGFGMANTSAFMIVMAVGFLLATIAAARGYYIRNPYGKSETGKKQRSKYITDQAVAEKAGGAPQINAAPEVASIPRTVDEPGAKQEFTPRLYKTRSDPNVIIAEFPDRYEYYKKTPLGVVYLETEYK